MNEPDPSVFDDRIDRWCEYAESPWGRIRFGVVRHTLERVLAKLGPGPLRILDVGGGDGRDSVPLARLGNQVTILDTSERMLAMAADEAHSHGVSEHLRTIAGSLDDAVRVAGDAYDIVLCHFLLQYRPDTVRDVRTLTGLVRPGGMLSLIAPNPNGGVLAKLVREGPDRALAELEPDTAHAVTFDWPVRKITDEEARAAIESAGCTVLAQYGGRCANDLLVDNDPKYDDAYFSRLEQLELALCDRPPFNRIGMFWQLVAQRDG
ncbi:MAG: methyltransferase domain-containing protein [Nocardioidaceae bacterium]